MNLYDIYQQNISISFNEIPNDLQLAKQIQSILITHKLLNPPANGNFGILSTTALTKFANNFNITSNILDAKLAELLIETKVNTIYNTTINTLVTSSNKPIDKIINYCNKQCYKLFTDKGKINIIYLEGCNLDFTLNDDAPNYFNDLRTIVKYIDNEPTIVFKCKGTTEPGRKYTVNPLNKNGAFRIAFGQHLNAWVVGIHKPGTSGAHEALIQVAPVTGYRDGNKDYTRTGDLLVTGMYGINQHWGYDMQRVEGASAGCLTSQTREDHREFMQIVKSDIDYLNNKKYRFSTIVLDASKVFS